jgi:RND family efflux transporter MFP subunit
VIAELDNHELQIQVERARAALAQALARVGLDPGEENARPDSSPAVRQAVAQMEDARFKYENARKLVQSGDISQERFTEIEKTFGARQAALEAAKDELRTQLASVQALRADVKLAVKRLGDATLRAPFDAAVTERLASPGQYLKENTPILTVVKTNPLRLRVEIPESAVATVRVGTTLTFTTDAAPGAGFHATVRELNPSLDAKSRSLTAESRLHESDSRLRPGMFVQVRLIVDPKAPVVVVPKEALHQVAGLTKVFVVKEGRAYERRIPPGQELGEWVEVPREQIRPGDTLAASNLGMLVDGAAVKDKG